MSDFIQKIKASNLACGRGCTEEQLMDAQNTLGLTFPQDFADYLLTFGIIDGWTGIGQRGKTGKEISKEDNTVTRTLMEREVNHDFTKIMFLFLTQVMRQSVLPLMKTGRYILLRMISANRDMILCQSFWIIIFMNSVKNNAVPPLFHNSSEEV